MLYAAKASRPDGRRFRAEESPGSTEKRCRITSGGGDPRESATENKPPPGLAPAARVKRCGKSAPRAWRHERHGKPHREQDRIGAMRGSRNRRIRLWIIARVGCLRRPATAVPEEWPSRVAVPAAPYRTRLTGRLAAYPDRRGWIDEGHEHKRSCPFFVFVGAGAALSSSGRAQDHDDFGSNQTTIMNVIDSKSFQVECGRKSGSHFSSSRSIQVYPTHGRAWCRRGPSPRSDNCAGPTDPRCRGSAPRAGARTPAHSGRPSHETRG